MYNSQHIIYIHALTHKLLKKLANAHLHKGKQRISPLFERLYWIKKRKIRHFT